MSDTHIPPNQSYYRLTLTRDDLPYPMYNKVEDDGLDEAVIAAIKQHQADGFTVAKVEAIDITVRVTECHEQLRAVAEGRA